LVDPSSLAPGASAAVSGRSQAASFLDATLVDAGGLGLEESERRLPDTLVVLCRLRSGGEDEQHTGGSQLPPQGAAVMESSMRFPVHASVQCKCRA